jgi:hypothetical protein
MKSKVLYAFHLLFVVIVAWGLGFSPARGQAGTPSGAPAELTGNVAGSFNYQGVLKENGAPVTGSRSMSFKLHTSSDCSSGLLQTFTPAGSISVTNGLFSVPISFDPTYISGQALYLEVNVTGSKLSCEALRPVPYALSLKPQARVDGAVAHDAVIYLHNSDTSTNYSDALYAIANGPTGSGVTGIGTNASGFGVMAINSSGVALHAEGKIWSDQDSVVELSPYSLVIRDAYSGVVVTPRSAEGYYGAVEVHFHGLPSEI